MSRIIRVIGLPAIGPLTDETYLRWIHEADMLVGGKRHLRQFKDFKGPTIPIDRDIEEVMNTIEKAQLKGKRVTVLATGDPLWFGIGTTLIRRFGGERVEIFPAVSSVQVALARLKIPMENAIVLSRHRYTEEGLEKLLYFPTGVILTDGKKGPSRIISEILGAFPTAASWSGTVCQRLGMPDERILEGSLQELATQAYLTPNILVVQNPAPLSLIPVRVVFGQPDKAFAHNKGMITHPEVRAIVLSKLELDKAEILWDLGAGSGAVGVEAALLTPQLTVHAVEKNRERIRHIQENRTTFGVPRLTIHEGNIRDIVPSLPPPDRIFIGGGGKGLEEFLEDVFRRLKADGILVATTITLESFEIMNRFIRSHDPDAEVIQLQVTRLTPFSGYHKMTPDNPITLFKIKKNVTEGCSTLEG